MEIYGQGLQRSMAQILPGRLKDFYQGIVLVLNGGHVGPVALDGLRQLLAGALVGQILLHLHA